jgi:hypothetical protein
VGGFRKFRCPPKVPLGRDEITAEHAHTAFKPFVGGVFEDDPALLFDDFEAFLYVDPARS